MNGLLAIAENFLDRMTNPVYGTAVNDEVFLRFEQILVSDQEFAANFANLVLTPEDIQSLPIAAWPWYLQWRTRYAGPPQSAFLDALFDATEDPAVRLSVTISAMSDEGFESPSFQSSDQESQLERNRHDLDAIRSRWLRNRFGRIIGNDDLGATGHPSADDIIEIATYLLQIGDTRSVESLRVLTTTPWRGRTLLLASLQGSLSDANLDSGTMAEWQSGLGLIDTPPTNGQDDPQRDGL